MTPAQRAIAAFEFREPDIVPTFELEFQLPDLLLGRRLITSEDLKGTSGAERERLLHQCAEVHLEVAERLDYSIVRPFRLEEDDAVFVIRVLSKMASGRVLVGANVGGGTFGIPSGSNMCDFVYFLHDRPEEAHERARKMAEDAIRRARKFREAGAEVFFECTDYAFKSGPFLSPRMFSEFVAPYLARIIEVVREELGAYFVKHTDGNIMPILDQIVALRPHAIHSIDPMAGMSLSEVKRVCGHKVALCGNVNCAILQSGTPEEAREDTRRALREGMPGGGFFLTTSNCVFRGMPLQNYLAMLEVRKRLGRYPKPKNERSDRL
ncbi:MAG TPA: hypothetical protein EYP65_00320 [Armatimonadetes bacterium]|nr:hypothetical protein [Armatimonadota bacterium]